MSRQVGHLVLAIRLIPVRCSRLPLMRLIAPAQWAAARFGLAALAAVDCIGLALTDWVQPFHVEV
jgi:hypothetical protein